MTGDSRRVAQELAGRHVASGDPMGWFEALYKGASGDASLVPWADLRPNVNLTSWLQRRSVDGSGRRGLVVGCGLGDDAEELSRLGFDVTAFDISSSAVAWCRQRFPDSSVRYLEADLLDPPGEWTGAFDLVVESYTLQVLPPTLRAEAIRNTAAFVAAGGMLLVVARGREPADPEGSMPWPLTRGDLGVFEESGLTLMEFEDYMDDEEPPVRRFRVTYERSDDGAVG